jgi:A/G-specific adenine glycosylase
MGCMKLTSEQITKFQMMVFRWWKTNKRDLPWRHTRNPYHIAVSEIMLQQTQVSRVLTRYSEFIEKYPSVESLANASPAAVLRIWKGMGYNRRALYLQKMAKMVVNEYNGMFPKDEKMLTKLPGLGTYTARAILVFAFGENVACVDTNIRQIMTHFFFNDKEQPTAAIQSVADQLVPKSKSWEWHQALMDYGAMNSSEWRHSERSRGMGQQRIPFHQTNRYFRGRIMDLLREKNWKEDDLVQNTSKTYDKPKIFFQAIILGLLKDGLLKLADNVVSLPE